MFRVRHPGLDLGARGALGAKLWKGSGHGGGRRGESSGSPGAGPRTAAAGSPGNE